MKHGNGQSSISNIFWCFSHSNAEVRNFRGSQVPLPEGKNIIIQLLSNYYLILHIKPYKTLWNHMIIHDSPIFLGESLAPETFETSLLRRPWAVLPRLGLSVLPVTMHDVAALWAWQPKHWTMIKWWWEKHIQIISRIYVHNIPMIIIEWLYP